ncbi:MAG: Fic family protein [Solirubrobacterales bacterium]
MLFHTPSLGDAELAVLDRIEEVRRALRHQLTSQRRWVGLLRRIMFARAIQGSNSIEGYNVSLDDAVAAVAELEPVDAAREPWLAVSGYRDAMTFAVQLADDPHFTYDESLIRSLHYMMIKYDLSKAPGRWRPGPVFVRHEPSQEIVYTAPDASGVPELMRDYVADLREDAGTPAMVRAAMAHLNLVMIHPFKDGNGRMGRGMQTLVLAREGIVDPPFASIEEYLGENTLPYYQVLGEVGQGSWHPERDARVWVRFVLTAHFFQAQRLVRRAQEAEQRWDAVTNEVKRRRLPERAIAPLFNASMGFRLKNATYREAADVTEIIAGRDLKAIAATGLVDAVGEKRGRYYKASPTLQLIERSIRLPRTPPEDPFVNVPQSLWSTSSPTTITTVR